MRKIFGSRNGKSTSPERNERVDFVVVTEKRFTGKLHKIVNGVNLSQICTQEKMKLVRASEEFLLLFFIYLFCHTQTKLQSIN